MDSFSSYAHPMDDVARLLAYEENWPEHHDGLGTVPDHVPTWKEFWS